MSGSVEPALVDLDDLCDACRTRVVNNLPKRPAAPQKTLGQKIGNAIGIALFVWVILAVVAILTIILVKLL